MVCCWFILTYLQWVSGHLLRFEFKAVYLLSASNKYKEGGSPKKELQTKATWFLGLSPPRRGSPAPHRLGKDSLSWKNGRNGAGQRGGGRGQRRDRDPPPPRPVPRKAAATQRRGRAAQGPGRGRPAPRTPQRAGPTASAEPRHRVSGRGGGFIP